MEPSLGLLHGGGGGTCDQSSKDYMGMQNESELELGLGLSLGGGATAAEKGSSWGRILTAKDFPNGFCCGTKRERSASDEGSASAAAAVSQVVGWPPIRAYRMNTLFNQSKNSNVGEDNKVVGGNETNENSKKKHNHGNNNNNNNNDKNINVESCVKERVCPGFVKVNMDGLPIGRKVDLHAHKNYESLANALQEMFFSPSLFIRGGKEKPVQPPKLLDGSSEFVLTYEDKEGDWMLVGDVPWGMFLSTVKRLRIMRTSDANGLAPKIQEKNEKQKSKLI